MFGFLQSENSKLRGAAKNWLYLGHKVYNFRKDQLTDSEVSELGKRLEELRVQLKAKTADAGKLKLAIEAVEGHMKKVGGAFYPQSLIGENVDFALYFLILYLGFTAFFIKPFKIPTNSMWPTYNGMTSEVWSEDNPAPGVISRAFRLIANGAIRYELKAPAAGELLIPISTRIRSNSLLPVNTVSKRHHLIIPGKGNGFAFEIGGKPLLLKTPQEFDVSSDMPMLNEQDQNILLKSWFPEESSLLEVIQKKISSGETAGRGQRKLANGLVTDVILVKSGLFFEKGETVLSFDIHTGDQLFVDRMSYHFVRPKVGDGFVFKTSEVPVLTRRGRDSYYIKRLSGVPGNELQINNGKLLVNGEEAQGSVGFVKNNSKEAPYDGYFHIGNSLLRRGETIKVPEERYVALGDNSAHSSDSRDWGYVPEPAIVGRPVLIFYPFTKRFGLTK